MALVRFWNFKRIIFLKKKKKKMYIYNFIVIIDEKKINNDQENFWKILQSFKKAMEIF